ncbi:MAG TPA: type III secretion system chaperone [Usitatibacter sp.]|nr:type III secretion system chaperone [Usitatibacter sp.]
MSDAPFLSLIKDLERSIGVPLDLREDESITFTFDADINVTLTPDERGNVVIDADLARYHEAEGEGEAAVARLLLLQNYAARTGSTLFAAVGREAQIVLTQAVPIGELDAARLGDRIQVVLGEVESLRRAIDAVAAPTPKTQETAAQAEEMLRTQTIFLRV